MVASRLRHDRPSAILGSIVELCADLLLEVGVFQADDHFCSYLLLH